MPLIRTLSRYVLGTWIRIFLLAGIGLPLVSVLIYVIDRLPRLLDRGLGASAIAQVALLAIPGNTATMIPAAALFATVFTIAPLARNSELTAAKAGGISFYRMILPLVVAAAVSAGLCYWVGEVAPQATARQLELEKERVSRSQTTRADFTFIADEGWTYSIRFLDTRIGTMRQVLLEHAGRRKGYPNLSITADSANWNNATGLWRLKNGSVFVMSDSTTPTTLRFAELDVKSFDEKPVSLLNEPKRPEEMTYGELNTFIETLARSGSDIKKLEVDLAIKLALPVACLVIALFGAPLAMTNPRAGAAWGIATSLGTTVVYLLLINLSKAVGAAGMLDPAPPGLAAWIPNGIFLLVGLILLARVRT